MADKDFQFLRLFKRLNQSTNQTMNPSSVGSRILEDIENTVKENEARINQLNEEQGKPIFVRNFEREHKVSAQELEPIETVKLKTQSGGGQETEPEKEEIAEIKPIKPLVDKKTVRHLAANMKTNVFGQDDVIDELVGKLKVVALKIQINKSKPAGSYFFAGPSGCGKTETANTLAQFLGTPENPVPFLKLDMGEFGMENDITKLIGPPPGYKGMDEGGRLTNFARDNKNNGFVVLLDEIEKAHPSMQKILLSILDKGVCADGKGETVYFNNCIVICTSNLGAEVEYEQNLTQEQKNEYRMDAIKQSIPPEIINRYDSIFHFHSLAQNIYEKILNKFLNKLKISMKEEHDVDIKFTPELVKLAVEDSYDPAMGGRPAERFIEKIIINPLADAMINETIDTSIHKELTMDLNKDKNVVFKNKQRKILGILENTKELISKINDNKFTKKMKI